jgi:ABC-type nitrate/sulfonate/bicarbonate transport system permease component
LSSIASRQLRDSKHGSNGLVRAQGATKTLSLDARARIIQLVALVIFLTLWEIAADTGLADKGVISSPSEVFTDAGTLFTQPVVWTAFAITGQAMAIAFLIGTAGGVVFGFAIGLVPTIREAYFGAVLFIMSTPKSIFIPIFLLVFGIGTTAPIAYAAFATFFYVCVNVVGGVELVQPKHLRVVTAFNGNWWHRIIDVVLPAAAPGVFAGVWYGIKHSVLEVLIMELYISTAGLGSLIQLYSNRLQTGNVLVVVLTVVIVSVLLGTVWNRLEARLGRWRPDSTTTLL